MDNKKDVLLLLISAQSHSGPGGIMQLGPLHICTIVSLDSIYGKTVRGMTLFQHIKGQQNPYGPLDVPVRPLLISCGLWTAPYSSRNNAPRTSVSNT